MAGQCLNCGKPLPKDVQSSFCSRSCWQEYKSRRGLEVTAERQATVMLKDTSRNLVTSLKSEVEKKDDIIRHQDRLIQEYRESLEVREKEIMKLQAKIRYFEGVVSEMRRARAVPRVSAPGSHTTAKEIPVEPHPAQPAASARHDVSYSAPIRVSSGTETPAPMLQPMYQTSFWRRLLEALRLV